ncbi:tetratricopeptide repeat-containing sensor histidine kinase [Fulvivirga ligni]|uniref:tetratricopeptide repeat-containing sensor histidine kinase n=1 Tax=Fulvivirga ligni TaxID=2904246 RepID=UPI001F320126|nr:histidine kinase dimerization/phosphoacceptor domain -containing protein [Fulvivirga ligni]UII22213.1 tetratricopeptide repeat protein [Fulvivirga ligni]
MRFILPLLFCLTLSISGFSQHSAKIDSLSDVLKTDLEPAQRAYILDELSYEWFAQNLDSSLRYGKLSYELYLKLKEPKPKGLAQAVSDVAVAFHYKNNWDSARFYYEKALHIREDIKDTAKVASSLNNLGVMYMDMGDYDKAVKTFLKAMKVREQASDEFGAAVTKTNIALIYKKQGFYDKSIQAYNELVEEFNRMNLPHHLETIYLNLGSIYNTMEEYEKGAYYNLKLARMAEENASYRNLAKSYVNLSNSYQGLGKLDSSIFYVTKALTFFEESKDTLNIAHSYTSMAQFLKDRGKYAEAIKYSDQLDVLNKGLKNNELGLENRLLAAEIYALNSQYNKAYVNLRQAFAERDSFMSESMNKTITDLTLKYDTEQKEKEISQLKVENQEAIIAQQQSANQRNILILVSCIVLVGLVLLFLLLRTKSKANKVISKSLSEKETLLKEIHHRVKNNLQIISSLLSLQTRFIEDENAKGVVNDSQNRVKSMALIHQRLYQHDNITGIDAQEYIENLTATLKATYGIDEDKVNVAYDIDPLTIDVDTIIPIGLILNELISNAFKYAFPEERHGALSINLKKEPNYLLLSVKDDGVGKENEVEKSDSFGLRMIRSLSRKLEADVNFDFTAGTTAQLIIKKYKLV